VGGLGLGLLGNANRGYLNGDTKLISVPQIVEKRWGGIIATEILPRSIPTFGRSECQGLLDGNHA